MPHSSSLQFPDAHTAAADLNLREAIALIDNALENISPKRREGRQNARDFLTAIDETLRKAVRTRPYTILAIASLAGFLSAAVRRRQAGECAIENARREASYRHHPA